MAVFMTYKVGNKIAIYDEAPGGGDPANPNSLRNRPLMDPTNWLDYIYFHSDLDNMEVFSNSTVLVNHSFVGGVETGGTSSGGSEINAGVRYRKSTADRFLVTHNLTYIPNVFVVVGSNVLFPGTPVQTFGDGRGRYISVYATTTQVRMYEWTSVSDTDLPAVSINYRILVIKNAPAKVPTAPLFDFNKASGIVQMARGRFNSSRNYLQVVPGGSPFGVAYGRTIDLKNGAVRFVNPNGSVFEPVPASLKGKFKFTYVSDEQIKTYDPGYGASMAYTGSFTGPTQILVQAP